MDRETRQKRIEELKIKNKKKCTYDTLFSECLEAISGEYELLCGEDSESIYEKMQTDYSFTKWGRIDFNNAQDKIKIPIIDNILEILDEHSNRNNYVYVLWGYGDYPVIKSHLEIILDAIENITAIGSDQWIYSPDGHFIIEIYHEGEILLYRK